MQDTRITAGMVAAELRKLADALDKDPEADCRKAYVHFICDTKSQFLNVVSAMPRPLAKSMPDAGKPHAQLKVEYDSCAMWVNTTVPQSLTCTLVEPAKPAVYKCDPILSAIEEAALEGAA